MNSFICVDSVEQVILYIDYNEMSSPNFRKIISSNFQKNYQTQIIFFMNEKLQLSYTLMSKAKG